MLRMRHVQFFASLAEASLSPYFGDAGGDSTSDLLTNSQVSYHCSFFFFFLIREEQRSRMVRSTMTFTCLTSIYFIFSFPMRTSIHHLCPTDQGEEENYLSTKSAKKAPPTTPKKANMQGKV